MSTTSPLLAIFAVAAAIIYLSDGRRGEAIILFLQLCARARLADGKEAVCDRGIFGSFGTGFSNFQLRTTFLTPRFSFHIDVDRMTDYTVLASIVWRLVKGDVCHPIDIQRAASSLNLVIYFYVS